MLSTHYSSQIFANLEFFRNNFKKSSSNFIKIHPLRAKVFYAYGQMDGHIKANRFVFRNFANAPLTLTLQTWRIWWAQNSANRWQMGFNSAFAWLKLVYVSQWHSLCLTVTQFVSHSDTVCVSQWHSLCLTVTQFMSHSDTVYVSQWHSLCLTVTQFVSHSDTVCVSQWHSLCLTVTQFMC